MRFSELTAKLSSAEADLAELEIELGRERQRAAELDRAIVALRERLARFDEVAALCNRLESENLRLKRELARLVAGAA